MVIIEGIMVTGVAGASEERHMDMDDAVVEHSVIRRGPVAMDSMTAEAHPPRGAGGKVGE